MSDQNFFFCSILIWLWIGIIAFGFIVPRLEYLLVWSGTFIIGGMIKGIQLTKDAKT